MNPKLFTIARQQLTRNWVHGFKARIFRGILSPGERAGVRASVNAHIPIFEIEKEVLAH
jgi:hypothetical protein